MCLSQPQNVGVYDMLMEIYTWLALVFFFWQWKESILLYVDKTYIQPLVQHNETKFLHKMQTFKQHISHSKTETQNEIARLQETV